MTDKRNGVPTLRAAAEAVVELRDDAYLFDRVWRLDGAIELLRLAIRTDRDLSARRTRRRRGTDVWAPVTPVNTRPRG